MICYTGIDRVYIAYFDRSFTHSRNQTKDNGMMSTMPATTRDEEVKRQGNSSSSSVNV